MSRPTALGVHLALELGRGLAETADPSSLEGALRAALDAELARLGLPGVAAVEVARTEVRRAFRIRVHGELLAYPPGLLARLWQAVAPREQHAVTVARRPRGEGFPDAWLPDALGALDSDARASLLAEMGVALTLALLRRNPQSLLDERLVAAYLTEAATLIPEARELEAPWWNAILRPLLGLNGTLADPPAVVRAAIAAKHMGLAEEDIVESVFAALRQESVEILGNPADIRSLHGNETEGPLSLRDSDVSSPWRARYEALERRLFDALGLPVPDIRLVPSATIESGRLELWIAGVPGLPARGLDADELIADATAEQLVAEGLDARAAIYPVTGGPAALVPVAARPQLEQAGIAFRDAGTLVFDLIEHELRAHGRRLLAIADIDHQLALLRVAFPAVVRAAVATFALGDLVRVSRLLVEEDLPLRDLRNVLGRLLEYDPACVGHRAVRTAPPVSQANGAGSGQHNAAARADLVREGLGDLFASRFAPEGRIAVVRVDPDLEARLAEPSGSDCGFAEEDGHRIREAVWSIRDSLQLSDSRAVVVTTRGARRQLRAILVPELPQLPLFAHEELPLHLERRTVGMIAL